MNFNTLGFIDAFREQSKPDQPGGRIGQADQECGWLIDYQVVTPA